MTGLSLLHHRCYCGVGVSSTRWSRLVLLRCRTFSQRHRKLNGVIMKFHQGALAYATTTFSATLMHTVFNFYYVKVYLQHFGVSESWFHVAQLVFMLWNAVNDPLFGYIQDHCWCACVRSRRLSVLYGAPWFVLSFLIIWFPWAPAGASSWVSGVQLLLVLCFYDALFTFVLLAQCALFTEMSPSHEDRLRLVQYSQVASLLGSSAIFFTESISENLLNFQRFQTSCLVIAVVSLLGMWYTGQNAHTPYDKKPRQENLADTHASNVPLSLVFRQTLDILRNQNFLSFVLVNFGQIYCMTFSENFSKIFCDYLIPDSLLGLGGLRSSFYASLFVLPSLSVIVAGRVISRVGYYEVMRLSFVVSVVMSLLLYLGGPHPSLLVIYFVVLRMSQAGSAKLYNLCLSDVIDQDAVLNKRSYPLSSMVFGTNALITKPAQSIAPMVTVHILARFGYSEDAGTTQADPTLTHAMFQLLVWTPLAISLLQLYVWSHYNVRTSHLSKPAQESTLQV